MTYHEYVLFALIWLQDELEGFIITFFCFVMLIVNNYFSPFLEESLGLNFYESLLAVDFIFFCVSFWLLDYKYGKLVLLTMVISFLTNLLPLVIDLGSNYKTFRLVHPVVNILLLEVLVGICFVTTFIYPQLKMYGENFVTWSKEKWGS